MKEDGIRSIICTYSLSFRNVYRVVNEIRIT
jgi:hypothetical protein